MPDESATAVAAPPAPAPEAPPASAPDTTVVASAPSMEPRLKAMEAALADAQRLAQEATARAVQSELARMPEAQRKEAEARIAQAAREAEMRRRESDLENVARNVVIERVAAEHRLPIDDFKEIAQHITSPDAVVALAKKLATARAATAPATEPALVSARPDAGGQGAAPTRESIVEKYTGTGDIVGMRRALRAAGYLPPL